MFKNLHHIKIASILHSLNSDLLALNACYFGGGTAITLKHGEFRESVDIDFLVSDPKGYLHLRNLITGKQGLNAIIRKHNEIKFAREVRADQYGIRTMLLVDNSEIKFEIVFEGRIKFEKPKSKDNICGVSTLTLLDMATSKLLANSDRWSDDSVFSRDLIDLAMLKVPKKTFVKAIEKATEAYGQSIERDLSKAIDKMSQHTGRLDICMSALKIQTVPKAILWSRIRNLKTLSRSFALPCKKSK